MRKCFERTAFPILFRRDKITLFGAIVVADGPTVILEVWVGAGRVLQICGCSSELISDCVKNNEFSFSLLFDERSPISPKPKTKRARAKVLGFYSLLSLLRRDRVFCFIWSRV